MTTKYVDAPLTPALRTVCPHLLPLLCHCLQNLVQYFKLAYIFSVWLSIFCANFNGLMHMQMQPP